MSAESNRKLRDWVLWWEEHRRDGGDVHKKLAFLEKAIEGLYEVAARQAHDLANLEGRPPESLGSALYLPRGVTVRGDLHRVG